MTGFLLWYSPKRTWFFTRICLQIQREWSRSGGEHRRYFPEQMNGGAKFSQEIGAISPFSNKKDA
jgi:hypothetical protein